jgi:hypothetical protein
MFYTVEINLEISKWFHPNQEHKCSMLIYNTMSVNRLMSFLKQQKRQANSFRNKMRF